MSLTVDAPIEFIESVKGLRLPRHADERLQMLMDGNNEGRLTADEIVELEALVEWSESLSLVRAEAMRLLHQRP